MAARSLEPFAAQSHEVFSGLGHYVAMHLDVQLPHHVFGGMARGRGGGEGEEDGGEGEGWGGVLVAEPGHR